MLKGMTGNDRKFCQSCGTEYNPAKDRFCSQCGLQFNVTDKAKQMLIEDIEDIESEGRPYEALRFTASLVIGLGWTVIIIGWVSAVFVYGGMVEILRNFGEVQNGPLFDIASVFFVVLVWALIAVVGIMIIAAGQFYYVLLDIRNDTHIAKEFIRRFGLGLLEKKEPPASK